MSTRRSFLASVTAAGALRASAQRHNVLFVVADDLNTALGCYGDPAVQSPHLDQLARRGVLFSQAHCQYPLCQPSRASFLSGLRPETTRVWTLDTPTRKYIGDAVLLPEHFRKNGYFTAMSGKVYHTGEHAEDPRSWDEEYREYGKNPPRESILAEGTAEGPRGHSFSWAMLKSKDEETPDGVVARRAVSLMEKAARAGKPFFIGAGFRRPHSPYAAPQKYFNPYPLDGIPLPQTPPSHLAKILPAAMNHDPPPQPMKDREVREFRRAYYACISFMDAQVGVLMDGLTRLRLWENTIVVFLGDNGYHLGDHGGLWHKNSLFEEGTRIPLIVSAPGRKGTGRRTARLVELVDLYPTLAHLCGLAAPPGLEGTSFAPLLDDPSRPWKKAAFTMQGRGKERAEAAKDIVFLGKSMRTERWRYTEWEGGKQGVELYDHQTDPGELVNLAESAAHQRAAAQLRAQLHAGWKAALPPAT
jgi:uncharacterized sulfatase